MSANVCHRDVSMAVTRQQSVVLVSVTHLLPPFTFVHGVSIRRRAVSKTRGSADFTCSIHYLTGRELGRCRLSSVLLFAHLGRLHQRPIPSTLVHWSDRLIACKAPSY